MMRIDSHMHVWSFEGVEYYDNKPLFTYMEELKLDRTALIAINNDENAKVKKLVEQYPNKFFGIAYVDRKNQEESLRQLECGVKAGYYKGIKVLSYQGGFHVDDPIQMSPMKSVWNSIYRSFSMSAGIMRVLPTLLRQRMGLIPASIPALAPRLSLQMSWKHFRS